MGTAAPFVHCLWKKCTAWHSECIIAAQKGDGVRSKGVGDIMIYACAAGQLQSQQTSKHTAVTGMACLGNAVEAAASLCSTQCSAYITNFFVILQLSAV
jgi:hypothetical protein